MTIVTRASTRTTSLRTMDATTVLWRLKLGLERAIGLKVSHVKESLTMALAVCPWSKELYYDAVQGCRECFSVQELTQLISRAATKEIHVRHALTL